MTIQNSKIRIYISRALFIFGVIAALWVCKNEFRSPVSDTSIQLENIVKEAGHNYIGQIPQAAIPFTEEMQDKVWLHQGHTPMGYNDVYHGYIREFGDGRWDIYEEKVYFSTIDNQPITDSDSPFYLVEADPINYALIILCLGIALLGFLIAPQAYQIGFTQADRAFKVTAPALNNGPGKTLIYLIVILSVLMMALITIHKTNRTVFPASFDLGKIIAEPTATSGFNHIVPFLDPPSNLLPRNFHRYSLHENGKPLVRGQSNHNNIRQKGRGTWAIYEKGMIYFSSSDNSSPISNGRTYSITGPRPISWMWVGVFAIVAFVAARLGRVNGFNPLRNSRNLISHRNVFWGVHATLFAVYALFNIDIALENISIFSASETFISAQVFGFYGLILMLVYYVIILPDIRSFLETKRAKLFHVVTLALICLPVATYISYLGYHVRNTSIGGMPYSDASGHFEGVLDYLNYGYINSWVGRRPLSLLMNTDKFLLSGANVVMIPIVSVLLGVCALYAVFLRLNKFVPGAIAFTFLIFAYPYFITYSWPLLSSNSGEIMACLGIVVLIGAMRKRQLNLLLIGTAILSIALFIRAGAYFILPMMGLLGYFVLTRGERFKTWIHWTWSGAIACAAGLILSMGLLFTMSDSGSESFNSNSQHTIYGFVHNADWMQIYEDFPEFTSLSLEEQKELVTRESMKTLKENPSLAAAKFKSNFKEFRLTFLDFAKLDCYGETFLCKYQKPQTGRLVLAALAICVIGMLAGDLLAMLIVFVSVGAFFSAGLVFTDGGPRSFGPYAPFVALTMTYSLYLLMRFCRWLWPKLRIRLNAPDTLELRSAEGAASV